MTSSPLARIARAVRRPRRSAGPSGGVGRGPRRAALAVLALSLVGCASAPIDTADAPPATLTARSAASVSAAPDQASGKVLWGGVILGAENLDDGTQLEMLAYPLDRRQRPMTERPSEGRFLILAPGYLETLDYADGRLLTVLGELDGVRDATVGEARRVYPAVRSEQLHLWRAGDAGGVERPRFTFGLGVNLGN